MVGDIIERCLEAKDIGLPWRSFDECLIDTAGGKLAAHFARKQWKNLQLLIIV